MKSVRVIVGERLNLEPFTAAWRRAGEGDLTEERVLSFESATLAERYFETAKDPEELAAYEAWKAARSQ